MERDKLYASFVEKYHYGDTPEKATDDDISKMEAVLATMLPDSYITFMLNHGKVYTPSLLDIIVEKNADMPDVQNIASVKETIEGTEACCDAGMPDYLIGFANDCMGNLFCFKKQTLGGKRPADLPVWFFDHDFNVVRKISESFDDWLLSFLRLS